MGDIDLSTNLNSPHSKNLGINKKNISILGSTGSIGRSTLSVLSIHKDKYNIYALSANKNKELLLLQCVEWSPSYAVIYDSSHEKWLKDEFNKLKLSTILLVGEDGLDHIASDPEVDIVMAAIVGATGCSKR